MSGGELEDWFDPRFLELNVGKTEMACGKGRDGGNCIAILCVLARALFTCLHCMSTWASECVRISAWWLVTNLSLAIYINPVNCLLLLQQCDQTKYEHMLWEK